MIIIMIMIIIVIIIMIIVIIIIIIIITVYAQAMVPSKMRRFGGAPSSLSFYEFVELARE